MHGGKEFPKDCTSFAFLFEAAMQIGSHIFEQQLQMHDLRTKFVAPPEDGAGRISHT
jgi:hypothetical protein